jgi:hypothetical protein
MSEQARNEAIIAGQQVRYEPLYKRLAGLVGAYNRCISKDANESQREWAGRHLDAIGALVKEHLPSGSGFDSGTKLDVERSGEERLVFSTSFHHMNEGGYYDGWSEHEVIVTPSLALGFNLRITGRDRNEIKDYMHQAFNAALSTDVAIVAMVQS